MSHVYDFGVDATVSADGRIFFGGWRKSLELDPPHLGMLKEIDADTGMPLWGTSSLWDSDLQSIDAMDVFANGEFVIIGNDERLARITQDHQIVWSLPPTPGYSNQVIDIGGPIETIAARRQNNIVEVLDADGTPRWQIAGRSVEVDPNGDVFLIVNGGFIEKRAGADGALLCSTPLPASPNSLALDEWGFPIVREYTSISKYSP
jgi:outer membrane protein assembly factor BamB